MLLHILVFNVQQYKLALTPNSICSEAPIPFCGDVPIIKQVNQVSRSSCCHVIWSQLFPVVSDNNVSQI